MTKDDLISRRAAIDAARDWYEGLICGSFKGLEKRLRGLPSAQPIDPVKHGKWIEPTREGCLTYDKTAYAECSECGKKEYLGWGKNYCPNCGANMERSEE